MTGKSTWVLCGEDNIKADFFAVDAWAEQNSILHNASKSQRLQVGGLPPISIIIENDTGTPVPLPMVSSDMDLRIMIDLSLKLTIQVDVAVVKARDTLTLISRTFEWLTADIFLPAYSALAKPLLESYVQAWILYTTRDVGKLEKLQAAAAQGPLT